jgi:hypothetical protein
MYSYLRQRLNILVLEVTDFQKEWIFYDKPKISNKLQI